MQTSTDPNFQTTLDDILVDQTAFTSYLNTYPEGPVYWRVQALDGSGNHLAWSDTSTFTKASPPPTLTSPAVQATQSGTQALHMGSAAVREELHAGDLRERRPVGQAANRVVSAGGVLQSAYTTTTPLQVSGMPYTWRVRRVDAKGRTGPWSPLQEFTITGTAPTLTSPAPGADVPPSDGLFTWQAVADATSYTFERRAQGSSTVSQAVTTAATAYAPTSRSPAATGSGGSPRSTRLAMSWAARTGATSPSPTR